MAGGAVLVQVKQAMPGDDLVSALISDCDGDERLNTQELLSTIFQLIVAGHDTTTSLIGNSVVALFRNPTQLALLRSNPSKIAVAVEELLRYDAPVPHSTFRYAIEPVEMDGVTIPEGLRSSSAWRPRTGMQVGTRTRSRSTSTGPRVTWRSGTPSTTTWAPCWPARKASSPSDRCCAASPELRLAVPIDDLHWNHGDGLVLRGLSELPVIPGPAGPGQRAIVDTPSQTGW